MAEQPQLSLQYLQNQNPDKAKQLVAAELLARIQQLHPDRFEFELVETLVASKTLEELHEAITKPAVLAKLIAKPKRADAASGASAPQAQANAQRGWAPLPKAASSLPAPPPVPAPTAKPAVAAPSPPQPAPAAKGSKGWPAKQPVPAAAAGPSPEQLAEVTVQAKNAAREALYSRVRDHLAEGDRGETGMITGWLIHHLDHWEIVRLQSAPTDLAEMIRQARQATKKPAIVPNPQVSPASGASSKPAPASGASNKAASANPQTKPASSPAPATPQVNNAPSAPAASKQKVIVVESGPNNAAYIAPQSTTASLSARLPPPPPTEAQPSPSANVAAAPKKAQPQAQQQPQPVPVLSVSNNSQIHAPAPPPPVAQPAVTTPKPQPPQPQQHQLQQAQAPRSQPVVPNPALGFVPSTPPFTPSPVVVSHPAVVVATQAPRLPTPPAQYTPPSPAMASMQPSMETAAESPLRQAINAHVVRLKEQFGFVSLEKLKTALDMQNESNRWRGPLNQFWMQPEWKTTEQILRRVDCLVEACKTRLIITLSEVRDAVGNLKDVREAFGQVGALAKFEQRYGPLRCHPKVKKMFDLAKPALDGTVEIPDLDTEDVVDALVEYISKNPAKIRRLTPAAVAAGVVASPITDALQQLCDKLGIPDVKHSGIRVQDPKMVTVILANQARLERTTRDSLEQELRDAALTALRGQQHHDVEELITSGKNFTEAITRLSQDKTQTLMRRFILFLRNRPPSETMQHVLMSLAARSLLSLPPVPLPRDVHVSFIPSKRLGQFLFEPPPTLYQKLRETLAPRLALALNTQAPLIVFLSAIFQELAAAAGVAPHEFVCVDLLEEFAKPGGHRHFAAFQELLKEQLLKLANLLQRDMSLHVGAAPFVSSHQPYYGPGDSYAIPSQQSRIVSPEELQYNVTFALQSAMDRADMTLEIALWQLEVITTAERQVLSTFDALDFSKLGSASLSCKSLAAYLRNSPTVAKPLLDFISQSVRGGLLKEKARAEEEGDAKGLGAALVTSINELVTRLLLRTLPHVKPEELKSKASRTREALLILVRQQLPSSKAIDSAKLDKLVDEAVRLAFTDPPRTPAVVPLACVHTGVADILDGESEIATESRGLQRKLQKNSLQELGLQALERAAYLSDLALETEWELLFQPALGPLPQFVNQSQAQLPWIVTTDSKGVLMKLPRKRAQDDFASMLVQALTSGDGVTAVAWALSALHESPTLAQDLNDTVKHWASHAKFDDQADGSSSQDLATLITVFRSLPPQLLSTVGVNVFLKPLSAVWSSYAKVLLAHAADPALRRALHKLGFAYVVRPWIEDATAVALGRAPVIAPRISASLMASAAALASLPHAHTVGVPSLTAAAADALQAETKEDSAAAGAAPTPGAQVAASGGAAAAPLTSIGGVDLTPEGYSVESVEICTRLARELYALPVEQNESEGHRNMREKVQRSTARLADELYSTEHHFLWEITQNADDNFYAADCRPTLQIFLNEKLLQFQNNENGFRFEDVKSLSSTDGSTKQKGNKGIGFKSVFSVTSRPIIHSRGYHFRFDSNDPEMRFVLPRPEPVPADWSISQGTRVVLPFKDFPSAKSTASSGLGQMLSKFDATVLLFLNKLRDITIHSERDQSERRLQRFDRFEEVATDEVKSNEGLSFSAAASSSLLRNPLPEVAPEVAQQFQLAAVPSVISLQSDKRNLDDDKHYTARLQHFLVFSLPLDVPSEKRRLDGEDRPEQATIAVAFPWLTQFPDWYGKRFVETVCKDRDVFAYLPVSSYGFSFMLQAPFDVTSSRESLDDKKSWNQYLCRQLPKLLADAFLTVTNAIRVRSAGRRAFHQEEARLAKENIEAAAALSALAEEDEGPAASVPAPKKKKADKKTKKSPPPAAAAAAAEEQKHDDAEFSEASAASDWLEGDDLLDLGQLFAMVPLPSKIKQDVSLFQSLRSDLEKSLHDVQCIPTATEFVVPGNALLWPASMEPYPEKEEHGCRRTMNALLKTAGLSLVHPRVAELMSEEAATAIGVKTMSTNTVLELLRTQCETKDLGVARNFAWRAWALSVLYNSPGASDSSSSEWRKKLESLPFVSLFDRSSVCANPDALTFCLPSSDDQKPIPKAVLQLQRSIGPGILRTVDPEFASWMHKLNLMSKLNRTVKTWDSHSFLSHTVGLLKKPLAANPCPDDFSPLQLRQLLGLALLVKCVLPGAHPDLASIFGNPQSVSIVLSDDTVVKSPLSGVHLWHKCPLDHLKSFMHPALDAKLRRVHADYAKLLPAGLVQEEDLAKMFIALGASEGLHLPAAVSEKHVPHALSSAMARPALAMGAAAERAVEVVAREHADSLPQFRELTPEVMIVLTASDTHELDTVLASLSSESTPAVLKARIGFMKYVAERWAQFAALPPTTVIVAPILASAEAAAAANSASQPHIIAPAAVIALQRASWLVVKDGDSHRAVAPYEFIVDTAEAKQVFGEHLPTLVDKCSFALEAQQQLQMRLNFNPVDVLQRIRALAESKAPSVTCKSLVPLYQYLGRHAAREGGPDFQLGRPPDWLVAMLESPFIFAGHGTPMRDVTRCLWNDPSGGEMDLTHDGDWLVLNYAERYAAAADAFAAFGVRESPTQLHLVDRLKKLTARPGQSRPAEREVAYRLLTAIAGLTKDQASIVALRQSLGEYRAFPSLHPDPGEWAALRGQPGDPTLVSAVEGSLKVGDTEQRIDDDFLKKFIVVYPPWREHQASHKALKELYDRLGIYPVETTLYERTDSLVPASVLSIVTYQFGFHAFMRLAQLFCDTAELDAECSVMAKPGSFLFQYADEISVKTELMGTTVGRDPSRESFTDYDRDTQSYTLFLKSAKDNSTTSLRILKALHYCCKKRSDFLINLRFPDARARKYHKHFAEAVEDLLVKRHDELVDAVIRANALSWRAKGTCVQPTLQEALCTVVDDFVSKYPERELYLAALSEKRPHWHTELLPAKEVFNSVSLQELLLVPVEETKIDEPSAGSDSEQAEYDPSAPVTAEALAALGEQAVLESALKNAPKPAAPGEPGTGSSSGHAFHGHHQGGGFPAAVSGAGGVPLRTTNSGGAAGGPPSHPHYSVPSETPAAPASFLDTLFVAPQQQPALPPPPQRAVRGPEPAADESSSSSGDDSGADEVAPPVPGTSEGSGKHSSPASGGEHLAGNHHHDAERAGGPREERPSGPRGEGSEPPSAQDRKDIRDRVAAMDLSFPVPNYLPLGGEWQSLGNLGIDASFIADIWQPDERIPRALGQIGERIAFEILRKRWGNTHEVTWLNEAAESYKPWDLELYEASQWAPAAAEGQARKLIARVEVKTTTIASFQKNNDMCAHFSEKELCCAYEARYSKAAPYWVLCIVVSREGFDCYPEIRDLFEWLLWQRAKAMVMLKPVAAASPVP